MSSSSFLRLRLVEPRIDSKHPAETIASVNIKEAQGNELVQKRKTFYPSWGRCFDAHIYPGRVIQIIVMSTQETPLAQVTVELDVLGEECMQQPDPTNAVLLELDMIPVGKIVMQVKLYGVQNSDDIQDTHNPDKLESMPKNATALRGRRGAVHLRQHSVVDKKGHRFVKKFFRQPAHCSFCHELLWGFTKPGYQCQSCAYATHRRCLDSILANCTGATHHNTHSKILKERFKINMPHRFKTNSYFRPTFCDLCGQMMHGLLRQGVKCEVCGMNCHSKCAPNMPKMCGISEKMLGEALKTVDEYKKNKRRSAPVQQIAASPRRPLSSLPDDEGDEYMEVTEEMTRMALKRNGHKPPPVPPRLTGHSKPMRKYSLSDFEFLKMLGKGSFGKVLLVKLIGKDQYFALKALKKDVVLEDDDVASTLVEKRILALGSEHPFITHLFCTFHSPSHLFFCMEYLNGGDLMFHIQLYHKFKLPRARFYAAEIVSALQFLHRKGIIYRDLKLDNVILDSDGHAKLADFGMCKEGIFGNDLTSTFCGTPDYISPEIVKGESYSYSVDWWSFGVLCYEMTTGQSPFSGENEDELFNSICNSKVPFPNYLPQEAVDFLKKLLERDSKQRLGCMEDREPIRRHPFFASIDWTMLEARRVEPPFKPKVKSARDFSNFDDDFTFQEPKLTPTDARLVLSIDQNNFTDFSYTNPQFKKL